MRQLSLATIALLACAASSATAADRANTDFAVSFSDCAEFVGIGYVPAERARPLVPDSYELLIASEQALLVVRVVDCAELAVDGKAARPARLAQIGIAIAGGDASADINNYLVWFATDHGELHGKLQAAGIANANDQQLSLLVSGATGSLSVDVSAPRFPDYPVLVESEPTGELPYPPEFVATWWADGSRGTVAMNTQFPHIVFGDRDSVLHVEPETALHALIGSDSYLFEYLDSYNEFEDAYMTTERVP